MAFVCLLKSINLLYQLLVKCLNLLRKECNLCVFRRDSIIELLRERMDVFVKLRLHLLRLLLQEENLVLIVDLRLRQALTSLITHIIEPLLEPDFLRVIELLKIGQLPLRRLINLIDRVLQLAFFVLKLLLKLVDFLLQALLGLIHLLLVLRVLFLAKG